MTEIKTWKERLQNPIYGYPEEMQCREDEVDELRTRICQLEQELAEAKKDQARYQMMRKAIVSCDRSVEEVLLNNLTDAGGNDEFDAAVDIAIKESSK